MKKILVTGGSGYIGSHTVVELINSNYEVIIIDNFSNSNPKIINRISQICRKPITVYNRDCRENIDDILSQNQIQGIIHFAAFKSVHESVENPIMYYDNNINSLLNILDAADRHDIRNVVFSSSCSVYGNLKKLPATELSPLSEPESPYANTKMIGEKILQDFAQSNRKIKLISLRYFNPVGAHESGLIGELPINRPNNILPVICEAADTGSEIIVYGNDYDTRDGSCVRDYVHVTDISKAHVLAIEHLIDNRCDKNYDVFNLGSGKGYSVLELIKSFENVNQIKLNYKIGSRRSGDVVEIYSDNTKSLEIGWSPKKSIEDMVFSSWKWYKNKL